MFEKNSLNYYYYDCLNFLKETNTKISSFYHTGVSWIYYVILLIFLKFILLNIYLIRISFCPLCLLGLYSFKIIITKFIFKQYINYLAI